MRFTKLFLWQEPFVISQVGFVNKNTHLKSCFLSKLPPLPICTSNNRLLHTTYTDTGSDTRLELIDCPILLLFNKNWQIDIFSAKKHINYHKVTIWSYIIIGYLLWSQIDYQSLSSFEPIYFQVFCFVEKNQYKKTDRVNK